MRKFFDLIKTAAKTIDGYWIESAGHPVVVTGVFRPTNKVGGIYCEDREKTFDAITPVLLYGFYDYPPNSNNLFSIDSSDEMEIQFNAEVLLKKLGKLPEIATVMLIEGSNWLVIQRSWVYNRFIGKYRIAVICQRYQESTTTPAKGGIHLYSSSGHTVEMNEE